MTSTVAVLSVAMLLASGAAQYVDDDVRPAPPTDDGTTLRAALNRHGVASVTNLASGVTDINLLSRVERVALLALVATRSGAELDVMVEAEGQFTPVETFWDGAAITFRSGAPRAGLYGRAPSQDQLQKDFGVGPFVNDGATWDNDGLYVVGAALSELTPDELALLAGVEFHRMARDPVGLAVNGISIAMYRPEQRAPRIELYNHGVTADRRRFVGTVDKPVPLTVATVLHEAAHAMARKPLLNLRRRVADAERAHALAVARARDEQRRYAADRKAYNARRDPALAKALTARAVTIKVLVKQMVAAQKERDAIRATLITEQGRAAPLERALDARLPYRSGPTAYARTSPGESFAECLKLHRLDRAALERAAPGVAAWFDSAEYADLVKASAY